MMRNHSYLMTGKDVQECYMRAYMLEQSATVQLQMLAATGGVLPQIPDHEECMFHRRSYEGYDGCPPYDGKLEWPGLVRGIDHECVAAPPLRPAPPTHTDTRGQARLSAPP